MQQGTGALVYYVFDLLEVEGEPLVGLPLSERRERLEALARRERDRQALDGLRRRRGAARGGDAAGARGNPRQARRLPLHGAAQPRVAEDQDRAAAGVRRRRLHARARPPRALDRCARARRPPGRRARLRRERRHRASATPSSTACSRCCGRSSARRRRSRPCRSCRACGAATSSGSSPCSWPRSRSPSGRTTGISGRRATSACARTSRRPRSAARSRCRPSSASGGRVLKLSNLDKPFWPEEGITKGDLLAYYRAVAPVVVPHLRDRPFTMKRYPDGWQGKHFFQKDAPKGMPEWIAALPLPRHVAGHAREAADRLPARQRRAGAALDGQHGLHRPQHLGLADRQPAPARLGAVRPRPLGGRRLRRRRSRWRCS